MIDFHLPGTNLSFEVNKWVLGVVLGLLGSIAINTGNNIQSLGLKQLQEQEANSPMEKRWSFSILDTSRQESVSTGLRSEFTSSTRSNGSTKEPSPLSSRTWVIGTFIFITGSFLNFASYAFAAQSMLASLESIQFVTNLMFGKFLLRAHVTKAMLLGTCMIVIGTILAVQFSSKETVDLNTNEMKQLYTNPVYIAYLCVMGVILILLESIYDFYDRRKQQQIHMKYSEIIMSLTYSVWSALFGTQSVVQAKVLAELLAIQSTGKEDIFLSWFTYVTIFLWVSTVAIWLKRLNDALERFNPLFIIPLLQCSFIFLAIVSGGIFFKEFNSFSANQWKGFWCGVFIMFSGLVLLTPAENKDENSSSKENIDLLGTSKATDIDKRDIAVRNSTTSLPISRGSNYEQLGTFDEL